MPASEVRQQLISRVRKTLDFLEANPDLPLPYDVEFFGGHIFLRHEEEDQQKQVLACLGSFKKEYDDDTFIAVKQVPDGNLLKFRFDRAKVCRRVVVGTKHIPEVTIPARPAETIAAHDEEIVEWDCSPIVPKIKAAEEVEQVSAGGAE